MNTPFDEEPRRKGSLLGRLRASFLTGLVVIAPVGLTIWLIWTVVGWIDGMVLPFVPRAYHPDRMIQDFFGFARDSQINVRGIGVIIFLVFTIIVGWMAKGLIGRSVLRFGESLVERTPVVRSIYSGIKQISETVFAQSERSFEKACLVEYPRRGIWAIGFVSTTAKGEIKNRAGNQNGLMSVFLPTTPNPTSGFLLFVPAEEVIELDMSVEDAAKLVISAGLVYPNSKDLSQPPE
ncbi:DUF502 domain-containing protein [Sulfitobacter pseudonitzschiae]|uniref:DUF502 domain-containing protein n=1 Tax=Pseudosulfitobacter pseudonitzschiae TaxID=1402135 RepID=A0A9Q2RVU3_9RHOB|nr:DUF502 domain-containing protein [Pseudosulfitobacter pseudonitzschiae]MBM2292716.1 DUF502 domain-containing protein [Pseudosulfitobacter pseudonitzschiae]MBM2298188.1 DUF502 domain-containing protein [Pseudosulfitobacter pseudonitzschiae]MBM2303102.1 DUF502 domain-containing protein [Pseudosulfitobacter pseudonitzschiae]MBM2312885.1 DUF502 domain-containing protein [Pseudosulfitobacter pseudonitzschiae]MBM2317798.1 DUF502 domain-containing protein [Pseudosulfitobacter pseudonitzschiae]